MSPSMGEWYRGQYIISTSQHLIQPEVVYDAFASVSMYWTKKESIETILKLLSNSLCFGLYILPKASSETAGQRNPTQIGLARIVTDEVTFAYLTDVFIVEEYCGKGLGMWVMDCINEVFNSWPNLRCALLMTSSETAKEFYKKKLGVTPFKQNAGELEICWKLGSGSFINHEQN